jgi:NAD(P)-dependent dehydrogenase (short-subunit alcohol dehydrogenase family)
MALSAELRDDGLRTMFVPTDVRDPNDVEAAVAAAEDTFGFLNVMVANAGVAGAASIKPLEDVTEREWRAVVDVNLSGVWRSFKYAAGAIRRAGGGAMTVTASIAGVQILGDSMIGAYTAAKHGAVALAQYFAGELASDGIRVNCVSPGGMLTNIDESYGLAPGEVVRLREARELATAAGGACRASCEPLEVAYAHLFLCSDEASFVSGANIVADGGALVYQRWARPQLAGRHEANR